MSDRSLYQSEAEELVLERGLVIAELEVRFPVFRDLCSRASGIQGTGFQVKVKCCNRDLRHILQIK